jgi:anaerobic selenocysteine-containing dehydrogenase
MSKPKSDARIAPYTHPLRQAGGAEKRGHQPAGRKGRRGQLPRAARAKPARRLRLPGCAWPDREHASTFEFCENGVKAVAAESTSKRASGFFQHTVTQLMEQSDYELEQHGRLTDPMVYDAASDNTRPFPGTTPSPSWRAPARAGRPRPGRFYTSGRASNEAAFLYQLFVRAYGTNNFPTAPTCATRQRAAACR